MCRCRDEAYCAVPMSPVYMVLSDAQEASILALCSRVGLHAHASKASYVAQPATHVLD